LRLGPDDAIKDLYREMDDTRFKLLLVGQSSAAAAVRDSDLLQVLAISKDANASELARVGIREPAFYLLRPDGHVGLCGAAFDAAAVTKYLADRAHLKTHTVRVQAA